MSLAKVFNIRQRNRKLYSLIAIVFLTSALLTKYEFLPDIGLWYLVLHFIGLGFILAVYRNSKCPSCENIAGYGWLIKQCKKCGVKFT